MVGAVCLYLFVHIANVVRPLLNVITVDDITEVGKPDDDGFIVGISSPLCTRRFTDIT